MKINIQMINIRFGQQLSLGWRKRGKGKERGKAEIRKGSEVVFTVFVDFLLKLVVGAWVFPISISISTCIFEIVHKNLKNIRVEARNN